MPADFSHDRSTCIVFQTHKADTKTFKTARNIYHSCQANYDVFVLFDDRAGSLDSMNCAPEIPAHQFSIQNLRKQYRLFGTSKEPDVTPGNNPFTWLDFSLQYSYDYYWFVEYDVRYSGEWVSFFRQFDSSQIDLLGTSFYRYGFRPDWFWWSSLKTPLFCLTKKKNLIRGFFPIVRISKKALELFYASTQHGWSGHHEVMLPTLLYKKGLKIADIGGTGEFTPKKWTGRNYINTPRNNELAPGTFVCPPAQPIPNHYPNTLYHPIK